MTIAFFLGIHMVICIIAGVIIKSGYYGIKGAIYPVVVCVPVCGLLLFLAEACREEIRRNGMQEVGIGELKIQEVRYKRIEVGQGEQEAVPLEEAMELNDSQVQRKLMMDILQRNPEQYIELLQRTRMAEDVELTHYATTTIQEIQSGYEQKIQELSEELLKSPENPVLLMRMRRALKKYIESGLLSGNILDIYRGRLEEILERLCAAENASWRYRLEWVQNRIAERRFEGVEEVLAELLQTLPEQEEIYRTYVEYYFRMGNKEGIRRILGEIKQKNIYLTAEGKKWYAFWNGKEPEE